MRTVALAILACAHAAYAAPPPKKKPDPPPSPERIRADKLFEDGRKYLANKEYALACTAFEQSQDADPAIGTMLNIALCYEQWGKIATAHRWFAGGLALAQLLWDDRAKGARKKVEELDEVVPRLRVAIPKDADRSAAFLFDGREGERSAFVDEMRLDPGKYTIEARVPGVAPKETAVELARGDRRTITIDVPRPEVKVLVTVSRRKQGRFAGGIALTVGGVATLGLAGLVTIDARQDYNDAVRVCPGGACESREAFDATQDARKRANLMTFVGIGGALVTGVGVYLLFTSSGKKVESRTQRTTLVPTLFPSGGGLAIAGAL
jgi:hypothetical protein